MISNIQDNQIRPKPSNKTQTIDNKQAAIIAAAKSPDTVLLTGKKRYNSSILLYILLFMYFLVPKAHAGDYYVDTHGNDSNLGSLTAPWRTISNAANKLVAGDTVYIRAGVYKEQVTPLNSGSAAKGFITYAAYPGETVTLDASGGLNWNWNGVFDLSNRSYLHISGLRIVNSPGFGLFLSNSTNMRIVKNYTYNTVYSGIYTEYSDTVTIDGNEVELANKGGESQESISIVETKNFIVSNNRVHGGGKEGIDAKVNPSNGKIFGNIIYDMARVGIYVDAWDSSASNIEIYNNIVSDSSATPSGSAESGIRIGGERGGFASDIRIYNNIVYNVAGSGIELSDWHETGYKEPQFSNVSIYNNTTHNCGTRDAEYGGGIDILGSSSTGIVIENNILSQNRYFPIRLSSGINSAKVLISNNLIEKSLFNQDSSVNNGVNAVFGSPAFMSVAENNFHLQANSPAINAGNATLQPAMDFDLKARALSELVDIGAFEFVSSAMPLTSVPVSQEVIVPTPPTSVLVDQVAISPTPTVNPSTKTVSITSSYTGKISASAATMKWTTNEPSTGTVYYGTDRGNLNFSATFNELSTSHTLNITGLLRRTTYYYKITATINDNVGATSAVSSFRTARGDKKG